MDKIKNKYEIILGFVTVIISLSAFKEELKGFTVFKYNGVGINAAEYLLITIIGFSFCIYLYVIENVYRDSFIHLNKFFDLILKIAFIVFKILLILPVVFFIVFVLSQIIILITNLDTNSLEKINNILNIVLPIASSIAVLQNVILNWPDRLLKRKREIENTEIIELENVLKLYSNEHYSLTILECFKIIELHLLKKLLEKGITINTANIEVLIKYNLKNKTISEADAEEIKALRQMRNAAAHTDVSYNKQQAENAIGFIKRLLNAK